MLRNIFLKMCLSALIILPPLSTIMVRLVYDQTINKDFLLESLFYSSLIVLSITISSLLSSDAKLTDRFFYVFSTMLVLAILASLFIALNLKLATDYSVYFPQKNILILSSIITTVILFLITDFAIGIFPRRPDNADPHRTKSSRQVSFDGKKFLKKIPRNLLISSVITFLVFMLFKYENNLLNHLGLLGTVISIVTLFEKR